jgi:hypothetical protein
LRIKQAADRAEHLSKEFVGRWRSCENIQAVGQCFNLSARELLGSAQSVLGAITFNGDSHKVRC